MKRTKFSYGQLDRVLRSLGFTFTLWEKEHPARVYQHESGAQILLPNFPDKDKVYAHHLLMTRVTLDNFGVADPDVFDEELQKVG